jgi:hypothetical protein
MPAVVHVGAAPATAKTALPRPRSNSLMGRISSDSLPVATRMYLPLTTHHRSLAVNLEISHE